MKRLLAFLWTALLLVSAQANDTVTLDDGSVIEGELQGRQAQFVLIKISRSDEEAYRRIAPDKIIKIQFSDTRELSDFLRTKPKISTTVPLLEQAAQRRSPFLGMLHRSDERFLLSLLQAYARSQHHTEALAYAKIWQDRLKYSEHKERATKILIQSAIALDLREEALLHAHAWIEDGGSFQRLSLPWAVAARAELDAGDAKSALRISLKPIAFGLNPAPTDLGQCYAVANAAAERLGQFEYAERIRAEARQRRLLPVPFGTSLNERIAEFHNTLESFSNSVGALLAKTALQK